MTFSSKFSVVIGTAFVLLPSIASAAPSVADALKLTPVQSGVDYDTPTADEVSKCTIKAEKIGNITAWVVRDPNNAVLRQFADSNGDNVVDIWSYFRDGLEVYRDIDANNNGKADQYRWFHSNGTRWALDTNEDNTIDSWKLISPEEVAEEVVAALAKKDVARFKRLLLTEDDIKKLGLDTVRAEQLGKRVSSAVEKFGAAAKDSAAGPDLKFNDFGGTKPGIVPAGSQGVTRDLQVYESVWAMVQNGDDARQMQVGTLISVGGSWKLIDGPTLGTGQEVAAAPFFFDPGGRGVGERGTAEVAGAAPSDEMQEKMAELQKLDDEVFNASEDKKSELNKERAKILREIVNMTTDLDQRDQWTKTLVDTVSAATQAAQFPDGVAYLKDLEAKVADRPKELQAHCEFQRMLAEYYGVTLADSKVNIGEAQDKWMKDLEAFVSKYPQSEPAAEALRAMAMGYEMAGKTDEAIKWYRRILTDCPNNTSATALANGAITRLTSEGQEIPLLAKAIDGTPVDLKALRGKTVVIQYWTTSSAVCRTDHIVLKELVSKYGGKNFEVISVNLDFDRGEFDNYLKSNTLPWKHVYGEQGFDGELASKMGIVTVPLNLLVGPDGKVISSNIQIAEVEAELKKLQVAGVPGAAAR